MLNGRSRKGAATTMRKQLDSSNRKLQFVVSSIHLVCHHCFHYFTNEQGIVVGLGDHMSIY